MNPKISVYIICIEVIIYCLLYNLHYCTLTLKKGYFQPKITIFSITDASVLIPCSDGAVSIYATS